MRKIIFLDTETTGNEPKKDFLCQLAYKTADLPAQEGETFCELYKPPIPIPPEASAVHHITNKMVADKSTFKDSPEYSKIKKMLESPDSIMVAHNNKFDYEILKNEDITPANTICTLRVARALDKNNVIPQYRLQFLRYYLDIEIEAEAHDALGDVLVLEKLYERLLKKIMEEDGLSEEKAIDKMIDISSRPSLMNMFNFGKYNGKTVADVARSDPGYLEWMLNQKEQSDSEVEEDWIYTLKYHLGKLV
jgi:DNA polymerase III epsilon subunit-like protein